jgi:hypothetical protein
MYMPVFSLWLSTQITSPASSYVVPIDKTNLANVAWRVDFDNLFKGKQNEYKFCRVRYNLIGETFTASTPASTDWTNYVGYLSVSLPSTFQADVTNGTILGLTYPQDSPITGTSVHCMFNTTMSDIGVDIITPTGVQQMNVGMMSWITNAPISTMQNYSLLLAFELYN